MRMDDSTRKWLYRGAGCCAVFMSTALALAVENTWPAAGPIAVLANAGFASWIGKLLGIPVDSVLKSALAAMRPEKAAQLHAQALASMPPEQAAAATVEAVASLPPEVEAAVRARFADVPLARMSGPVPAIPPAPRIQLVNTSVGASSAPADPAASTDTQHEEDTPANTSKR